MFKQRYLPILKVLLFVIGIFVLSEIEWYRAYAACRDKLSTRYAYAASEHQFKYQHTRFSLIGPVEMFFDDGKGGAWCNVRRHGLKWEVNGIIEASPYP